MSEHDVLLEHEGAHPQLQRLEGRALRVGLAALVLLAVGGALNTEQFFRSYLLGYLFWVALALGCLMILALHHIVGGGWSYVIRRCAEAGARTMPLMALLFVPVLLGMDDLYLWARPDAVAGDELLQHKQPYLNMTGFILRSLAYFAIWGGAAYLLTTWSLRQDQASKADLSRRMRAIAAPTLLLAILAGTFASFDWIMSLEPHWFSTIFGLWFVTGAVLTAFAFVICALAFLGDRKPLAGVVKRQHYHDLGNLTMAFVLIWAYLSFSQYLIIWSGNTQEEAPWYLHRSEGGWTIVAVLLIVFHFALPFAILLSRRTKRALRSLVMVAAFMLVMRWVDLLWQVAPNFHHHLFVHWMDLVAPIAVGCLWLVVFARYLKDKPLLPLQDPDLVEELQASGGH